MAVCVSLTQDGHEPEDGGLYAETVRVGRDQTLGGQFGGAVQRCLHWKRRVLRCRKDLGLAVDGSSGRERDPAHAVRPHRFEYIRGGDRVLFQVLARMFKPEAHICIRSQMEHKLAALHRAGYMILVQKVTPLQMKT